ncbi:MAG: hypothetical protein NTY43_03175, partial [Bacteroidetes bacterium]|nr:hypothetical protein [Bacteroidota bacterium]
IFSYWINHTRIWIFIIWINSKIAQETYQLIYRFPRPDTGWWAHSRKATLSRVYAVKCIDPFYLWLSLAKFGPGSVIFEGKQG